MRRTANVAGATRDCAPRVPARRGEMPAPAAMSAEVFATAMMAAEMLTSAGGAAGMRAPSPAVTMATTVTAAFWAGQRQARQRNREDCDGNDAKKSHGGCSMRVPFGKRGRPCRVP
jgi:hypothetical protein